MLLKSFVLAGLLSLLPLSSAADMLSGSEQFYTTERIFLGLNILPVACGLEDDIVNFACGSYLGNYETFQVNLDAFIKQAFPGLQLAHDWFPSGVSFVRDYRSSAGQYLFSYNPEGYIVVAFIPLP